MTDFESKMLFAKCLELSWQQGYTSSNYSLVKRANELYTWIVDGAVPQEVLNEPVTTQRVVLDSRDLCSGLDMGAGK